MRRKISITIASLLICLGCSREYELEAQFGSVRVTPASGLTTTEIGGTATFQIVLSYPPKSDVTFTLKSSNATEGLLRATAGNCDSASVNTADTCALRFTPANWDIPQSIVVVGQDDALQDGNITYAVAATSPVTSDDPRYNGLVPVSVSLTNTDNDAGVGVILSRTSGLVTSEAPASDSFTVRLASQPSTNVTLNLASTNVNEGTVALATVTFTNVTWNTDRTIIVSGVTDNKLDGDISYAITIDVAAGSDPAYDKTPPLVIPNVSVTNTNIDTGKRIFLTTPYRVTTTPPLIGGIPGADAKCDAEKPVAGLFKAILVGENGGGTTIRDRVTDWVLAANTKYYRHSDGLLIGTTNGTAVFPFNLTRPIAPGFKYWTGLMPNWAVNPNNCNAFAGGGSTGTSVGNGNATDGTAINDGVGELCGNPVRFLCAEQ